MPSDDLATDGYEFTNQRVHNRPIWRDIHTLTSALGSAFELNPVVNDSPEPVRLVRATSLLTLEMTADARSIVSAGANVYVESYDALASGTVSRNDHDGDQRFYFEMYCDEFEVTIGYTAIGFSVSGSAAAIEITGTGDKASGIYCIRNDGIIYENGNRIGNIAGFTTGDVIGAEIDFADGVVRFYKNGVEAGSQYGIDLTSVHRDCHMVGRVWATATQNVLRRMTMRFADDIQYLPAGCLPYDWQNA